MSLTQIIPIAAILLALALVLGASFTTGRNMAHSWAFWAFYAVAYAAFTTFAIAADGALTFWTNHSSNWIGNQVWIDLVIAIAIGWILILPEARSRDMNIPFWLVFVVLTATIGFGAMFARLLYLRAQEAGRT